MIELFLLNGFNFFAFYKGQVLNCAAIRLNKNICKKIKTLKIAPSNPSLSCKKDPLSSVPIAQRTEIEHHLAIPKVKNIVYVTHVGVYAGDIYEFNGAQYLATWNLDKNAVETSIWDYLWGTSDTEDPKDLAITNETFNNYRNKTQKGGDFLALSPVKLTPYPMVLPVY